jgi:hypothetical protein
MTMKAMTIFAMTGAALLATAAQATTTSVDFRTYAIGTSITTQIPGVTFSLEGASDGGAPQIAYYTGWSAATGGLSNSTNAGEYPTANRLVATFSHTVSDVKFLFDNEGYNGGNYFAALDSMGNTLATGALDVFDPSNGQAFDLTGTSGIKKIFWDNGTGGGYSWTQSLVTLSFNSAVPEPASWALMVSGFGLVGATMRRRSRGAVTA